MEINNDMYRIGTKGGIIDKCLVRACFKCVRYKGLCSKYQSNKSFICWNGFRDSKDVYARDNVIPESVDAKKTTLSATLPAIVAKHVVIMINYNYYIKKLF